MPGNGLSIDYTSERACGHVVRTDFDAADLIVLGAGAEFALAVQTVGNRIPDEHQDPIRSPMNPVQSLSKPAWLTDADERPHVAADIENWSENYLTYVWSPSNEVGIYTHLCRLPGDLARWDELM